MATKRTLFVNWIAVEGAAQGKRKLKLSPNENGEFICPVQLCLHTEFKSKRGLRKHIDNKHPWYFYFDEQPEVKREEIEKIQPVPQKQNTRSKPHYSIEDGIGKNFYLWLSTTCGGGKNERESKQIAKRAMKFLMECTGENESDMPLNNELLDCCLGSPQIIIKFLTTIEKEWKMSFSTMIAYVKSITDLLDFRKSEGVTDNSLRCFTVIEVYLRRAKENLRKKKRLEYSRNFDLETLIARDSWASIEEMERVVPYHLNSFKSIIEKCKSQSPFPTKHELTFTTRFIATFLFLRVKCSRPMTFQYLTLDMINQAKENNGFVDQRQFKTAERYLFDTLIMTPDVLGILDLYIKYARPLFNPATDYLLVSTAGTQYQSLTTAMSMLVHQAIGKCINPTRYRQIVETESAEKLTRNEQEIISEDQKHTSTVAKVYYKKKQSHKVALEGKRCMEKLVGDARDQSNSEITKLLSELEENANNFDQSVLNKAAEIINYPTGVLSSSSSTTATSTANQINEIDLETAVIGEDNHSNSNNPYLPIQLEEEDRNEDLTITNSIPGFQLNSIAPSYSIEEISASVKVKKETASTSIGRATRNTRFTSQEDQYLKEGIKKYGFKNWSLILKDKKFQFHSSRTRDSLRMRADSVKFKNFLTE